MKNKVLLKKLINEGKLRIVNPSEEIKESYIEKSGSSLTSAKILLENNLLEEAIALTYYSMYNSVIALMFKCGIKCENHTASITLLKEIFGIDNSGLFYAKKERIDKQYYTDFHIKTQEVEDAIKEAEIFASKLIDFISRINNLDVLKYREKLSDILGVNL